MTEKDTQTAGPPRWVKVFGVIALVLLVVVLVMLVTGRGGHGPGRHAVLGEKAPSGEAARHRPPTSGHAYR